MHAIEWDGKYLRLLNQLKLPHEEIWERYETASQVADAIVAMKVRGAPAIASAAAYGVALEAIRQANHGIALESVLKQTLQQLLETRPTAVNLRWAMERMQTVLKMYESGSDDEVTQEIVREAEQIAKEDVMTNRRIGQIGLKSLFQDKTNYRILTHCNTGSLATVEYGTALGIIRSVHADGRCELVYVDETRPYLQGARLTAYELSHEGIPHVLITDSMAGAMMQAGQVDAVIVGADRIAANGDTANKIGTYSLAVLANYHHIPFYVAAPISTFDVKTESGHEIPIEYRSEREVTHWQGQPISPHDTKALHPAFDVTPQSLITAIVTEKGVIFQPNRHSVLQMVTNAVTEEV